MIEIFVLTRLEAEFYNQVFGSTNYRDIMCLYFEQHIQGKGFKPCKVAALKLLKVFMNQNPNMSISSIVNRIKEFSNNNCE